MNRRKTIAGAGVLALVCVLVPSATAGAEYRGTDMWSNLMPGSGGRGLADRYPLSYYVLDYHVDGPSIGLGGPDVSSVPAAIAQWFSSALFSLAALLMRLVISVFDWSFGLDLITGPHGGLLTSSSVVQSNYSSVVLPFLAAAIVFLGAWVAYKAVKRDSADVGSTLVRVVVMAVVSIAIVYHPTETIGRAYSMSEDAAAAIISAGEGKQSVSDRMFDTFVYRPMSILQFGGLRVCTGDQKDGDDYPLAATNGNPAKTCHSVLKKDRDDHGDYARIMMQFAPGSDERKAYYEALKDGKQPKIDGPSASQCPRGNCPADDDTSSDRAARQRSLDEALAGVKIDRTDSPAVDMMQEGGAAQRFLFTILIVAGMAGGILLLGLIVIARLFAQIALLLLFQVAPFMILVALVPSMHGFFVRWAKLLGKVLIAAVFYAVVLSIVLSTSAGLMALAGTVGYFFALLLQSALFLGVFFKRKAIFELATSSKTAMHAERAEHHTKTFVGGAVTGAAMVASGGVGEAVGTMREGWKTSHPSDKKSTPDSTSPPASAGRDHSPVPDQGAVPDAPQASSSDVPSTTHATMPDQAPSGAFNQEDEMPTKTFREELNNARARSYDQADTIPSGALGETPNAATQPVANGAPASNPARPATPPPQVSGIASASTFSWDLEDERRERDLGRRE